MTLPDKILNTFKLAYKNYNNGYKEAYEIVTADIIDLPATVQAV